MYGNQYNKGQPLQIRDFADVVGHQGNVSSFVGMVQWWIKNRLQQSPEELADYFMVTIAPIAEL